jgi:hypothetical protein
MERSPYPAWLPAIWNAAAFGLFSARAGSGLALALVGVAQPPVQESAPV